MAGLRMETLVIRAFYHLQEVARSCSLDLTWLEGRGGNELGFAAEALLSVEPGSPPKIALIVITTVDK